MNPNQNQPPQQPLGPPQTNQPVHQIPGQTPVQPTESNVLAIVGFILAFIVPVAGLIVSILGFRKAKTLNGKGRGLALAGIIISAIVWAFIALIMVLALIVGVSEDNEASEDINDLFENQQLFPAEPE